jgi:hypothetical protein
VDTQRDGREFRRGGRGEEGGAGKEGKGETRREKLAEERERDLREGFVGRDGVRFGVRGKNGGGGTACRMLSGSWPSGVFGVFLMEIFITHLLIYHQLDAKGENMQNRLCLIVFLPAFRL